MPKSVNEPNRAWLYSIWAPPITMNGTSAHSRYLIYADLSLFARLSLNTPATMNATATTHHTAVVGRQVTAIARNSEESAAMTGRIRSSSPPITLDDTRKYAPSTVKQKPELWAIS